MTALRELSDLPGPPALPFFGNLLQLNRDRLHLDIEAWGRRYGPFFRFQLGPRRLLVVSDHAALTTLLRDRPDGFRRTVHLANIALEMGLPQGVFGASGDDWRRQRRMVMAGLDPSHLAEYFPSLRSVVQRLERRWQVAARRGDTIELQPELMRFTVDTVAGLAFGADVNTLESDADPIQHHLDKIFPALFKRAFALVPWWRIVRLPSDRRLARSVAEVSAAIAAFVAEARARLAADPARRAAPPNLLEAMIVAATGDGPAPATGTITDEDIAGNVLTMLLAGEDTTANTLAWLIHLLHRHPAALRRAQDEVRALAPDPSAFTLESLGSLSYLDAAIHETMRLKPVAPFQVVEALRDSVVAGIRVPEGTGVWCLMRGDSVDERHVPGADRFEPERWGVGGGAAAAAAAVSAPAAPSPGTLKRLSMPFGAGPRICPGRALALLEMKAAMAMLLARFDIASVTTPDGREPAEQMAFTMMPVGLRMRLRPHGA